MYHRILCLGYFSLIGHHIMWQRSIIHVQVYSLVILCMNVAILCSQLRYSPGAGPGLRDSRISTTLSQPLQTPTPIPTLRTPIGTLNIDIQVVRALHEEVKSKKNALDLYRMLQENNIIDSLFHTVSDVKRLPDAIVFFYGATNRNVWCLIGPDLRTPIDRIDSGSVIASVVFEDEPTDQYRLQITTDPTDSQQDPEEVYRITPLLTGTASNEVQLLGKDVPNLPNYTLRVEYYRMVQVPCTIIARIDTYSRRSVPSTMLSLTMGALFPFQQRAFFSQQDSVVRVSKGRNQLDNDILLGFDVHWGRTRSYTGIPPWQVEFWETWWQRFGVTFGTTITNINDQIEGTSPSFFNRSFVGLSINVYKGLNIVSGASWIQRPDITVTAPLSILNSKNIERDFPGRWERLFSVGFTLGFPIL